MAIIHPIPIGTAVISMKGEWDSDCDDGDRRRDTGPKAEGVITTAHHYAGEGWTYDVYFPGSGVSIRLVELEDQLDDPTFYRFVEA